MICFLLLCFSFHFWFSQSLIETYIAVPRFLFKLLPIEGHKRLYEFMHIGQRIKEVLKEDGHSVTWFASQICCTRQHVYKIFNRKNLDTEVLTRICRVLNHDFYAELSSNNSLK